MRRIVAALVATAALVVGGTVAVLAAIPDASGLIHGCYDKNGYLRVVDPPIPPGCTPKERALTWNQKGPLGCVLRRASSRESWAICSSA
jgi:hypothetical protein